MLFDRVVALHCCYIALWASGFSDAANLSSKNQKSQERCEGYFSAHDLCESEIVKAEQSYGIPRRLFLAIGTVESGRPMSQRGKRPWPWTICANGKGHYFSTKSAAIATVKKLMARGIRNIDVGCMQVNLLHHSKAFRNLEEAFTPKYNVNYAAKFFTDLKKTYNSWTSAVGYYHSKAEKYYKPYCNLVYNEWKNVHGRVINNSAMVHQAAAVLKSDISFLPPYYSLIDTKISEKFHKLGRQTLSLEAHKFSALSGARK
jgi:hypothetical protein